MAIKYRTRVIRKENVTFTDVSEQWKYLFCISSRLRAVRLIFDLRQFYALTSLDYAVVTTLIIWDKASWKKSFIPTSYGEGEADEGQFYGMLAFPAYVK